MSCTVVDTLITGAKIITMDAERRVYMDGALAITGSQITAVGPRQEIEQKYRSDHVIDGRRFVISPGFVNSHIHVTGDPLTRNYVPDDIHCPPAEKLTKWVLPRYEAHGPEDEKVSAQLAALEMLRSGATSFIEAGTVRYLDEVVEGVDSLGIRGRVGAWVGGRAYDASEDQAKLNREAIRQLEDEVARYPAGEDTRISAWPLLIGHSTNSDEVWLAAKQIADDKGLGISAHMSPYKDDPDWFLETYGRRPIEHLADLGVLGDNVCLTHVAHIDESERQLIADSGTNVIFCPLPALKGVFGITSVGRFPEMAAEGVNMMLGTDGYDADIMHSAQLVAALFKDTHLDTRVFPAHEALSMLTLNGAKGMGMADRIGSLEAGKKADFVCHDTDRPEWRPLLSIVNQLIWSADGRGVHSVWVDGVRVIDNYHSTMIDEDELYANVQRCGERVIARSKVPFVSPWPVL
ncbi:amidohydrolase family protein [Paremcibacter congregatus]|uniref:amidohydrolase family protein n=1 Tax=Paremcibacter congregatus TaxID=2043170 RepID=UPI003A94E4FC